MSQKVALITGITGQDGSYLAEFLLDKGYLVHGMKRRSSLINTKRVDHIYQDIHEKGSRFILHHGDMTDGSSLLNIIKKTEPDEIYNLAAQSHVAVSFEQPEYTANSDALGTLRILEAIRSGLGKENAFLSSKHKRALWEGSGDSSNRTNAFLPPQPLRSCQTLCLLDYGKLSRGL